MAVPLSPLSDEEKDPRRSLVMFSETLYDEVENALNEDDGEMTNAMLMAIVSWLCSRLGHKYIEDDCGIPDHRYCVWCTAAIEPESLSHDDLVEALRMQRSRSRRLMKQLRGKDG